MFLYFLVVRDIGGVIDFSWGVGAGYGSIWNDV